MRIELLDPEQDRGQIKGGVFVSRLAFLRDEGGEALVEKILSTLPAEDQRLLADIILASAWYPFATNERLDLAISKELGGGDQLFRQLGQRSAQHNLGTTHRNYVRDRDTHGLLRQAASIYRLYYDTGSRTYEKLGPTKAILRTVGSKSFSRADCLTVVGWHEKAIEMCGGHDPHVSEVHCRARGDELCEYVCEWK